MGFVPNDKEKKHKHNKHNETMTTELSIVCLQVAKYKVRRWEDGRL